MGSLPNLLESTEVSAVPAKKIDAKVAVQGMSPLAQCNSSYYMSCCEFGVPCDCRRFLDGRQIDRIVEPPVVIQR